MDFRKGLNGAEMAASVWFFGEDPAAEGGDQGAGKAEGRESVTDRPEKFPG
jgi:hypothetical protein